MSFQAVVNQQAFYRSQFYATNTDMNHRLYGRLLRGHCVHRLGAWRGA